MLGTTRTPRSLVQTRRSHVPAVPAPPQRYVAQRAVQEQELQLQLMERGKGVWYIGGQTWNVGERYTLQKVIGHGSFSAVCLAKDNRTGELIALKRIGDVLSSPHNARRVLREVCILRRVEHPNIIALRDVFLRPAATGRLLLRGGRLVPASLDIYIGMEYADRGDLYSLRGQLSQAEVQAIMWQLLDAVRYLHTISVWHRDIKSANVLLTSPPGGGPRIVKLADLGSARSAAPQGYSTAEQPPAIPPHDSRNASPGGGGDLEALYARPKQEGGGFVAPLTGLVSTPCYRAPEVVMSRGGYTSALDMWSVGCIMGELLQRVAYLGKASTPHLSVAPVFAMSAMPPPTPRDGESYEGGAGDPITRLELEALFTVIGTPTWACIEGVRSSAWRRYLRRLRGRAPQLFRRFGPAGEPAVDLLARLLSFDPARRATAEEALAHEFFDSLQAPQSPPAPSSSPTTAANPATPPHTRPPHTRHDPTEAVATRLDHMDLGSSHPPPSMLSPASPPGKRLRPNGKEAAPAQPGSSPLSTPMTDADVDPPTPMDAGPAASPAAKGSQLRVAIGEGPTCGAAGASSGGGGDSLDVQGCAEAWPLDPDPARALAGMEQCMAEACLDQEAAVEALRALLVAECDNFAAKRAAAGVQPLPLSPTLLQGRSQAFQGWEHLMLDPAASRSSSNALDTEAEAGKRRVPHHADAEQACMDPEQHLRRNRHTEWAPTMPGGPPVGPSWGVTLHPPGVEPGDVTKEMEEVLRRQNRR